MDRGGSVTGELHIAMLPWLAVGHLIPFLHLSKRLAQKGHRISFITTTKNAATVSNLLQQRTAPTYAGAIDVISIPLPHSPEHKLPPEAESTMDIKTSKQVFLKRAFDSLSDPIAAFLRSATPDLVIHDFTSPWVHPVAAEIGAPCVFYVVASASTLSFFGPTDSCGRSRLAVDDLAAVPSWLPAGSTIGFRAHEVKRMMRDAEQMDSKDLERFKGSIKGSDLLAIRTCSEIESEWISFLFELHRKPVIPIGPLFPGGAEAEGTAVEEDERGIKEWLGKQRPDSVVYVALGTETVLTREELAGLANGLEKSGLPFLWVLRNPPESTSPVSELLPTGFEERVKDRGLLYTGWAPQIKVLGHPAVRGFLTHCGWNSVIEGLGFGRVLVLLPIMNDQPLVARLLVEKGLGVEIERNESDGSLEHDSVLKAVRFAVVEKEGEALREKARAMKNVFGNQELNDRYFEDFVKYVKAYKKSNPR